MKTAFERRRDGIGVFLAFLDKTGYPMQPCKEHKIGLLRAIKPAYSLPNAYIRLMTKAGNGIGFYTGSDYTASEAFELQ